MAFEQLRQSDASISDIAEQLGFQEPSAFHRAFKKWTGESPGRYRARYQGDCGSEPARESDRSFNSDVV
ncbi:DNA-binding transcriptional regulator AraC [compost metagenome]